MSDIKYYGWYCIKVSNPNNETVIKENFDGNNTAFVLKDFEWNENKIFEASIDLTNCKNKNENIISIGNNVKEWQGSGIINLHLFYDINSNKLIVDWVNQDDPYTSTANPKYEFTLYPDSKTLIVKITQNGLFINNKEVTSDWFKTRFVKQIYSIGNNIQAGAAQGNIMSNAHYNYIKTYDKFQTVTFGHLPWENKKADGEIKQSTDETFDYFTQKIVATIDLSYCINLDSTATVAVQSDNNDNNIAVYADSAVYTNTSKDYTILSVGTDIKEYGTVNDNNFHVYYNVITNKLIMDCVNNTAGSGKFNKTVSLDDSSSVITLEICNKDFKLNNTSYSDVLYNIIPVIKNKKLQFGFVQGEGYVSRALYKDVHIEDLSDEDKIEYISLPQTDFVPSYKSKKWLANVDKSKIADSSSYILSMQVNTNSCSVSAYQNLLSVGNNILLWASKSDYNIHLYYNKSKNLVQSNLTNSYVYKYTYKRQDITNLPSTFNINLSYNGGLSIKTDSDCTVINDSVKFISYIYNNKNGIEYGACEGNIRFQGQYSYMKYVENKGSSEDNDSYIIICNVEPYSLSNSTSELIIDEYKGNSYIKNLNNQNFNLSISKNSYIHITNNNNYIMILWFNPAGPHMGNCNITTIQPYQTVKLNTYLLSDDVKSDYDYGWYIFYTDMFYYDLYTNPVSYIYYYNPINLTNDSTIAFKPFWRGSDCFHNLNLISSTDDYKLYTDIWSIGKNSEIYPGDDKYNGSVFKDNIKYLSYSIYKYNELPAMFDNYGKTFSIEFDESNNYSKYQTLVKYYQYDRNASIVNDYYQTVMGGYLTGTIDNAGYYTINFDFEDNKYMQGMDTFSYIIPIVKPLYYHYDNKENNTINEINIFSGNNYTLSFDIKNNNLDYSEHIDNIDKYYYFTYCSKKIDTVFKPAYITNIKCYNKETNTYINNFNLNFNFKFAKYTIPYYNIAYAYNYSYMVKSYTDVIPVLYFDNEKTISALKEYWNTRYQLYCMLDISYNTEAPT